MGYDIGLGVKVRTRGGLEINARMAVGVKRVSRREHAHRVVASVVSNADLIEHILMGNVGPSAFVAASGVCKMWNGVCRSSESLLRQVALYQDGLTKKYFCGLFAITPGDARHIIHTTHLRSSLSGGMFCIYGVAACDQALALNGMDGLRARLITRLNEQQRCASPYVRTVSIRTWLRRQARLEETLHARAVTAEQGCC